MVIVTTLFNAEVYIQKCLWTIMHQNFRDYTCYITDDLSTDNSRSIVRQAIRSDNRFVLVENAQKLYQPGNYDQVIRDNPAIDDNEIIVEVDGDDWLSGPEVLQRINRVYTDERAWIANGSFIYSDGRRGFAAPPGDFDNIRNEVFAASHIRTWKAFLWRAIEQDYLKDESGKYYSIAGDLAFMLPMLEMAGPEHYRFMPDINYIYNEENPINDHKVNLSEVTKTTEQIRKRYKYNRLTR